MKKVQNNNWMGVITVSTKEEQFSDDMMNMFAIRSDKLEEIAPNKLRMEVDFGYTDRVFAGYLLDKTTDNICVDIDQIGGGSQVGIININEYLEQG